MHLMHGHFCQREKTKKKEDEKSDLIFLEDISEIARERWTKIKFFG